MNTKTKLTINTSPDEFDKAAIAWRALAGLSSDAKQRVAQAMLAKATAEKESADRAWRFAQACMERHGHVSATLLGAEDSFSITSEPPPLAEKVDGAQ